MPKIIQNLKVFTDNRGCLIPIEFSELEFKPVRAFYVKEVPVGDIRGGHAHYKTTQFLICIQGCLEVVLHDGKKEKRIKISSNQAVLIPALTWDYQKFLKKGTVLLVLCNTPYNAADYITDFDKFKRIKRQQ